MVLKLANLAVVFALSMAAQTATPPNFGGTWSQEAGIPTKLVLTEKDGNIHIVETKADKVETDFICPLSGQECAIKQDGHSEKAMVYHNGDKLVEIIEGHQGTSKKRFTVSADGKTLSVEVVPLSAKEKTETILFHRQAT